MLHFEKRLREYTYDSLINNNDRDSKARCVFTRMQQLQIDHNIFFNNMVQEINNMIMQFGRHSYLTDLRSGSTDDRNDKLWNSLFHC